MNLADDLRALARSLKEDWEFPQCLYDAADIIDSLPKAEDGSVIWRGCWCVLRVGCTVHITRCWGYDAVEQRGWFGDNDKDIDDVWFTIEGASEVLSTHRTRDEAEAAAKRAGGEG